PPAASVRRSRSLWEGRHFTRSPSESTGRHRPLECSCGQVRCFMTLYALLGVVLVVTAGCAGESAMRTTASISASMLNDYRTGLVRYVQVENDALSATAARINDLTSDERFIAASVDARITAWKAVKNEAALNVYNAMTVVPPEIILSTSPELKTLQPAVPAS